MRQFGLIGFPLSHSFSKKYFTEKFEKEGWQDCRYDNHPLSGINQLPALLQRNPLLEGLNITIPYKEQVLSFLSDQSEVVKETGACNCIKIAGCLCNTCKCSSKICNQARTISLIIPDPVNFYSK